MKQRMMLSMGSEDPEAGKNNLDKLEMLLKTLISGAETRLGRVNRCLGVLFGTELHVTQPRLNLEEFLLKFRHLLSLHRNSSIALSKELVRCTVAILSRVRGLN